MKRLFAYLLVFSTLFVSQAPPILAGSRTNSTTRPLIQDVRSAVRQAEARFDSGNVSGAADLARRILEKYPNNAEAQALLEKCIATENADYEAAVASLDATKLADFKHKYPSSSYADDVSRRIEDLPYWLPAKEANTVEGYRKYLAESPHLLYKREADDAIKEIAVKQAYDAALAKNTIQAYKDFIEKYPDSKYEKDASNKIARLMADKFDTGSSYADKAAALAYAQNEMTRDYVNNKYNRATLKRNSSSTTPSVSRGTSASSTSSPSTSPQTSVPPQIQRNKNTNPFVSFGLDLSGDYYNQTFLLSAGPILRFGRTNSIFFLTIAAKYAWGGFRESYWQDSAEETWWGGSNRDLIYVDGRGNYISVPVTLNWNTCRSLDIGGGFYIGVGFMYNHLLESNTFMSNDRATSILWQMGFFGRHWDARFGMNMYRIPFANADYAETSTIMGGFTYYF